MLAINRAFNGDARVEYVEADLFEYVPNTLYDLVFAGFWLSHVPEARFGLSGTWWRKRSRPTGAS